MQVRILCATALGNSVLLQLCNKSQFIMAQKEIIDTYAPRTHFAMFVHIQAEQLFFIHIFLLKAMCWYHVILWADVNLRHVAKHRWHFQTNMRWSWCVDANLHKDWWRQKGQIQLCLETILAWRVSLLHEYHCDNTQFWPEFQYIFQKVLGWNANKIYIVSTISYSSWKHISLGLVLAKVSKERNR